MRRAADSFSEKVVFPDPEDETEESEEILSEEENDEVVQLSQGMHLPPLSESMSRVCRCEQALGRVLLLLPSEFRFSRTWILRAAILTSHPPLSESYVSFMSMW